MVFETPSDQPTACVLAVDLGGTHVRVAKVGRDGRILAQRRARTFAGDGPDAVIAQIAELVEELAEWREADVGAELATYPGSEPLADRETERRAQSRRGSVEIEHPHAVGVAAPGPLDPRTGIVFATPNLEGWRDFAFRDVLADALGLPVHVHNDANLAGLGEALAGAGRGHELVVYLTVSTGVGGGIIRAGRIEEGATGLAGELGHVIVDAGGPACNFGHAGCLEGLASGTAIARAARERIARGEDSTLGALPDDGVTAEAIAEAARSGDPLALAVMDDAATWIGLAIGGFVNTFDPHVVIIGGGVSLSWDLLQVPMRSAALSVIMAADRRRVEIVRAALGDDSGLVGAGLWVWAKEDGGR